MRQWQSGPLSCRGVMRGFGLIEWLMTLALTIGIVAFAVGPWRRWWLGVALARTEHALLASLSIARHEAVRRNQPVGLCRADAMGACADTTMRDAAGKHIPLHDWRYGWLVVTDRQGVRNQGMSAKFDGRRGADTPLILHRVAAISGVSITANNGTQRLVFRPPLGQSVGRWGRFTIAPERAMSRPRDRIVGPLTPRCIWISGGGRARRSRGHCG